MSEQEFIELAGLSFNQVRNLSDEKLGELFDEMREKFYQEGYNDAY